MKDKSSRFSLSIMFDEIYKEQKEIGRDHAEEILTFFKINIKIQNRKHYFNLNEFFTQKMPKLGG